MKNIIYYKDYLLNFIISLNILTLYGYLIIYEYLYFSELVMIKLNENFIRLLSSLAEKKREIYVK